MLGDCNTVESWAKIVGNFGFPIFVAVYLLMRLEPAMRALAVSLDRLSDKLSNHT